MAFVHSPPISVEPWYAIGIRTSGGNSKDVQDRSERAIQRGRSERNDEAYLSYIYVDGARRTGAPDSCWA